MDDSQLGAGFLAPGAQGGPNLGLASAQGPGPYLQHGLAALGDGGRQAGGLEGFQAGGQFKLEVGGQQAREGGAGPGG